MFVSSFCVQAPLMPQRVAPNAQGEDRQATCPHDLAICDCLYVRVGDGSGARPTAPSRQWRPSVPPARRCSGDAKSCGSAALCLRPCTIIGDVLTLLHH